MNHARTRRLTAGAIAMTLLAGVLTLFVLQPAQANHGDRSLQVSPEVGIAQAGSPILVTATLSSAATGATGSIPIDAEIESGPADADGPTTATPDTGCSVPVGSSTCTFTVSSGSAGASQVRVWIDHDNRNEIGQGGVTEADLEEGRLANGSPDSNPQAGAQTPSGADCRVPEDYSFDDSPPVGKAGGCGATVPPTAGSPGSTTVPEPDTTDVIELRWTAPEALDCRAKATGTDRVVESDPVTSANGEDSIIITCTYTGGGAIRVDGANISGTDGSTIDNSGANDPNGTGGVDYTCESTTTTCEITVTSGANNAGPAVLCFWVDSDNDAVFTTTPGSGNDPDGQGCAEERVDDPEGDDRTDRVHVRWGPAPVATTVDLDPESGSSTVGSTRVVIATVADQYGDPMHPATTVSFEFGAGSPGDNGDDSTPSTADKRCATSNGRCGIAYEVANPGTDVLCGWFGDAPAMSGTSPSGTCGGETAGNEAASARIDVVTFSWTTPAATGGSAESVSGSQGYTLVGADGGIFNFGTSQFHGSTGDMKLNQPIIGLSNKRGGTGYWLVAKDGGIFTFGDAEFHGSTGDMKLNAPAVGLSINDRGDGYWLVAQDGGIFSFGNVPFHGSTGSMKLNQPVFDMASTAGDKGYWLVAKDGGIFSFGDAESKFQGSAVGATTATVIGMGTTPTYNGYWIADSAGAVFPFGDARALGDRRGQSANAVFVGFATVPRG